MRKRCSTSCNIGRFRYRRRPAIANAPRGRTRRSDLRRGTRRPGTLLPYAYHPAGNRDSNRELCRAPLTRERNDRGACSDRGEREACARGRAIVPDLCSRGRRGRHRDHCGVARLRADRSGITALADGHRCRLVGRTECKRRARRTAGQRDRQCRAARRNDVCGRTSREQKCKRKDDYRHCRARHNLRLCVIERRSCAWGEKCFRCEGFRWD